MITIGIESGIEKSKFDEVCFRLSGVFARKLKGQTLTGQTLTGQGEPVLNVVFSSPTSIIPADFEGQVIVQISRKLGTLTVASAVPGESVRWDLEESLHYIEQELLRSVTLFGEKFPGGREEDLREVVQSMFREVRHVESGDSKGA